jgi:hypothetical protein
MSKQPRTSSAKEDKTARLQKRIETLERDVLAINKQIDRFVAHYSNCVQELANAGTDMYERINHLESSVFPNLTRDIAQLNKIVPFSGGTNDDLDRRTDITGKPKPKRV